MSDTLGALTIPVAADTSPIGDPALGRIGRFLKAVVNVQALAAWTALRPGREGANALPIKTLLLHNPEEMSFNPKDLPALFLYRKTTTYVPAVLGDRQADSTLRGLWVFPPEPQEKQVAREPFGAAIGHIIYAALESPRHPAWADTGDTDALAASVAADPDAIKTSVATSVAPESYSGAGLNGAVGATTMSPRRELTITTSAVLAPAYNIVDPIVVTYTNWDDRTAQRSIYLDSVLGGETVGLGEDVKAAVSFDVPAQTSALGTFQFGAGAFSGFGSSLFDRAALSKLQLKQCQPTRLKVGVLDESDRIDHTLTYDAVELELFIQERLDIDTTDTTRFHPLAVTPAGADLDILDDEAVLKSQAWLPDANG
jgi:hypothetical protein